MNINETVDKLFELQNTIYEHVGYVEQWRVFPIDDERESFWSVEGPRGEVRWTEKENSLFDDEAGDLYAGEIYTQRHLSKWVYRGAELTMVIVNTHCDGNIFAMLFDNKKERPWR